MNLQTYACEEPVTSDSDGQLFVSGVHSFDDAAELLHEELQLVFVLVDVFSQQHGDLAGNQNFKKKFSWCPRVVHATSLPASHLFKKGLQCIVARLLHLAIDVSAELGHDVEKHPVVVHQTAAELGSVSGQQVETGFFFFFF